MWPAFLKVMDPHVVMSRLIALSDAKELGGLPSQYPFCCIKGFFQIAQLFVFLVTGGSVFTVILATTYELSESILK